MKLFQLRLVQSSQNIPLESAKEKKVASSLEDSLTKTIDCYRTFPLTCGSEKS